MATTSRLGCTALVMRAAIQVDRPRGGALKRILVAGDHFMRPELIEDALRALVTEPVEFSTLLLPWPHEPFRSIGEVNEASGSEDDLIAALEGIEICVTQMAPFTERVLGASRSLRFVAVARGGPVNVNVPAATRLGIAIASAPGRNAQAVAEYTIALMLATMRRIPAVHADLQQGVWRGGDYAYERAGTELAGTTVGLIGFGAVGSAVAHLLAAFGSQILVFDPYVDRSCFTHASAVAVGLAELLERSRVVSLHARLSEETQHIIGAAQLATMARGSYLINTARGALVDTDALCAALESGHLAGAALDVFDPEPPPPGSPILRAPNLVLSPHLSGASKQTAERAAAIVAHDVARYLAGAQPYNLVNPEVFAGPAAAAPRRAPDRNRPAHGCNGR